VIDDSDVKQQMVIVENGVNYNVKKYNDLRITNERLILELKAKLDELDDQKGSFEELEAMKKAQTEESLRIESLKVDTARVEQSIHHKVHYTRRLEHILNRLKSNQVVHCPSSLRHTDAIVDHPPLCCS
jgi:predicted nuclease with TOPRIM domain